MDAPVVLDVRQLDVTDPDATDRVLAGVRADHGRLDALVNKAGAGDLGTVETDTVAEFRRVMEVNFIAVVALSRAAMPHLRASGGRPVTGTASAGSWASRSTRRTTR